MYQITNFNKLLLLAATFVIIAPASVFAESKTVTDDAKKFDKLYADWTSAFNKKDMAGTMSLFAPSCVASLPDANHKTYEQIRDGFKKLFADKDHDYKYSYDVLNIYHDGNLAAVRITWHLTTTSPGKPTEKNDEHGLDVLQKDAKGAWTIVNWVAFSSRYQH